MKFPYLRDTDIEGEAAALLAAAIGGPWQKLEPVDLETVVYEYLSPRDNLIFNDDVELPLENGDVVLGKTLPVRGQILLNRNLKDGEPGRARFTLAHELGHWVLHRKLFLPQEEALDLFTATTIEREEFTFVGLNRTTFPQSCRTGAIASEEWQANRFAVALLINADVLRHEFFLRFGVPVIPRVDQQGRIRARTLRELARQVAAAERSAHAPLRVTFGLSIEAMAIALETRGYVTEHAPAL